jgi:methylmalonyl-CoA/ethylmalonyl-CoA epimerase
MIKGLDHVAIAVDQFEEGIRRFAEDLGLQLSGTEDVEGAKTSTAFFPVKGTQVELIHPLRGEGPVAGFLEKRGPGLHHICFETDDIEAEMQRLDAKGYRLLSERPQPGAHGTRVVFIHPRSTGGVLIELVEYPEGHDHP